MMEVEEEEREEEKEAQVSEEGDRGKCLGRGNEIT